MVEGQEAGNVEAAKAAEISQVEGELEAATKNQEAAFEGDGDANAQLRWTQEVNRLTARLAELRGE